MKLTTNPILIGMDFSVCKPAVTVLINDECKYFGWPYKLPPKVVNLYRNSGVIITDRTDYRAKSTDLSDKMNYEVKNSAYLADLMVETLKTYLTNDTYVAFEGLSYGSGGNSGLQLSGYKYLLMDRLSRYVPYDNMFTYSPLTIKSVAGCAKKGMGKNEMIEAFIKDSKESHLKSSLISEKSSFKKKNSNNWVDHLDDIVDSYWALITLMTKENLK